MDFMTTTKKNVDVVYRETVEEPPDEEGNEEPLGLVMGNEP